MHYQCRTLKETTKTKRVNFFEGPNRHFQISNTNNLPIIVAAPQLAPSLFIFDFFFFTRKNTSHALSARRSACRTSLPLQRSSLSPDVESQLCTPSTLRVGTPAQPRFFRLYRHTQSLVFPVRLRLFFAPPGLIVAILTGSWLWGKIYLMWLGFWKIFEHPMNVGFKLVIPLFGLMVNLPMILECQNSDQKNVSGLLTKLRRTLAVLGNFSEFSQSC